MKKLPLTYRVGFVIRAGRRRADRNQSSFQLGRSPMTTIRC